jgi:ATP-binding cassette, subfamily C, bacterial CydD
LHSHGFSDQKAYARYQVREQLCADWLRQQSELVRKSITMAAAAGIAEGVAIICQAALLAYILNAVVIDKMAVEQLFTPLLLLFAIFVVRGLCSYGSTVAGFAAGASIKKAVRKRLQQKLVNLGPGFGKKKQSGALASVVIEQVEALEYYYSRYLPQRLITAVLPILIITIILPVNWPAALIFLICGPLMILFMALTGMGAASTNRSQFLALQRMGGYFLDRLQCLGLLKLYGQSKQEVNHIAKVADDFRQKTMAVLKIAFLSSAVLEFFSAVAVALVAVYVGLGLLGLITFGPAGEITLQEALFVLLLAPEFFVPLRKLAVNYHDRSAALGAADAILEILELAAAGEADSQKDAQQHAATADISCLSSSDPVISLHHVSKRYSNRTVLDGISLQIKAGEKIALVGETGSGKTTLINLLLGFEAATKGQVLLCGADISQLRAGELIAWVGQNPYLFYGSIHENIALSDQGVNDAAVFAAAQAAGVLDFTQQLADGLQTRVGERGYGLSGGQVQRIALARAFLKNSPIIILDEPTANLDLGNKKKLLAAIEKLFTKKTLVIATHDPEVANRMGRTVELHQGRLVGS